MFRGRSAADWTALALGSLMIILGVVLAVAGAWMIALGGSLYYMPAGVGLVISGYLLARRRAEGAWLYLLLFLLTLVWAWWEVGPDDWALVRRTVGPALLLISVTAITPKLHGYRYSYESGATMAAGLFLLIGTAFLIIGPSARTDAAVDTVPPPSMTMVDPSLRTGADWPAYGGSYSAPRYSPLDKINREDVSKITRV